ncbi:MAG TPA: succinylglutamate desuccinylase/aspartoacylase family protein [Flavitalea sp.]|nr:succinylglutamate desuccinylase/aspartoacylase family protein [Flavitalea sp.]
MTKLFDEYEFDSDIAGPSVLITAGVHGDEYEPVIAAKKLIEIIPTMLKIGKITIVPILNVSANQLDNRCGVDGLDLARTCPGKPDGSITEKVAFEASQIISRADYYIDLHTGGKIFNIFPLSGYMLHDSQEVLDAQRMMAQAFGLPVIWGTDRKAEGRTLSVARDANVPAIYVEYGGPAPVSGNIINKYITGCLNVLSMLGMTTKSESQKPDSFYWVEDRRLNNGHLQSKTPSPVEGVFTPRVSPGIVIKTGDVWGTIQDPISQSQREIESDADGLVLFTRVTGHVNKGDSLGGILPITKPGKISIDEQ